MNNQFNKRSYQYYTKFSDVVTSIKVTPIKNFFLNSVILGHPSGMWLNDGKRNGFPV